MPKDCPDCGKKTTVSEYEIHESKCLKLNNKKKKLGPIHKPQKPKYTIV